jgi:hypothetical protein
MKSKHFLTAILILLASTVTLGQSNNKISTIEMVKIKNGNKAEALYYFEHNWKVLREMAVEKGYIDSYQLLYEKREFDLLLITTFTDQKQYDKREDHFAELIQKAGSLKLLNDKKPTEFRESWMSLENLGRLE